MVFKRIDNAMRDTKRTLKHRMITHLLMASLLTVILAFARISVAQHPLHVPSNSNGWDIQALGVKWEISAGSKRALISYNNVYGLLAAGYYYDKKVVVINRYGDIVWSKGVDGYVNSLSWSPNGEYIAVGTSDWGCSFGSLYLFDRNGRLLWKKSLYGDVYVAWSPYSDKIAAAAFEANALKVYRLDGSLDWGKTFPYHIFSVSWSPDGKFVAIGTAKGCNWFYKENSFIYILDAVTGSEIFHTYDLNAGWIHYLKWDLGDKYLYAKATYRKSYDSPNVNSTLIKISLDKRTVWMQQMRGYISYIEPYNLDNVIVLLTRLSSSTSAEAEVLLVNTRYGYIKSIYKHLGSSWLYSRRLFNDELGLLLVPLRFNNGKGELILLDMNNGQVVMNQYKNSGIAFATWINDKEFAYSMDNGVVGVYSVSGSVPSASNTLSTTTITVMRTKTSTVTRTLTRTVTQRLTSTVTRFLTVTSITTKTMVSTSLLPVTVTSTTTSTIPITRTITRVLTSTLLARSTITTTFTTLSAITSTSIVPVTITSIKMITNTITSTTTETTTKEDTTTITVNHTITEAIRSEPSMLSVALAIAVLGIGVIDALTRRR